jgi:hypothetical protein
MTSLSIKAHQYHIITLQIDDHSSWIHLSLELPRGTTYNQTQEGSALFCSLRSQSMTTDAEESSQSRRRAALLAATTVRLEGHSRPAPTIQQGGGTSSANRQWTPPSAEDDRKKKLDFARICTRDIMGANNYAAAASCISVSLTCNP